jgi:hypothetical protein
VVYIGHFDSAQCPNWHCVSTADIEPVEMPPNENKKLHFVFAFVRRNLQFRFEWQG